MAQVIVNFERAFKLNLGLQPAAPGEPPPTQPKVIEFAKGIQPIDESLLGHWYVRANLVGAERRPAMPGQAEYLAEDMVRVQNLKQIIEISNQAARDLEELRGRAQKEGMKAVLQGMMPASPPNEVAAAAIRRTEQLRANMPPATKPTVVQVTTWPSKTAEAAPAPAPVAKESSPASDQVGSNTFSASGRAKPNNL
jgi:hypothetical protein